MNSENKNTFNITFLSISVKYGTFATCKHLPSLNVLMSTHGHLQGFEPGYLDPPYYVKRDISTKSNKMWRSEPVIAQLTLVARPAARYVIMDGSSVEYSGKPRKYSNKT